MNTTDKYGEDANRALDLWTKLARAFSVMNRLSARDIATYGLTQPQLAVLDALGHLGPLTIGELCRKMLVSGGNMTVVLDNLQKDDLIDRTQREEDRRSTEIRLTSKGRELFDRIFPCHAEFIRGVLDVLTKKEQDELSAMLKKLGLALQQK